MSKYLSRFSIKPPAVIVESGHLSMGSSTDRSIILPHSPYPYPLADNAAPKLSPFLTTRIGTRKKRSMAAS